MTKSLIIFEYFMKNYLLKLITILFFVLIHTIIPANLPPEIVAIRLGFEKFLGTVERCDCKPLAGGLSSNTQYLCIANDNKYVARILKKSLTQRQHEIATHLEAMRHHMTPQIHYHHSDAQSSLIIMDFIDGHTL